MADTGSTPTKEQGLGKSARASILWGGGFTLLRDVAQFVTMLILVRVLSPEDYGSAALAQSIVGLIAVVSFGTFVLHTLQLRDPEHIDWQAHFTAAAAINSILFCLTLLIAWGLLFSERYHSAAMPLAGLATVFLVEIPGTLRHRMLETRHNWQRFRVLLIIGTGLALAVGLLVALLGGGVWALIVQVPLFGLPAAVDLFWHERWRPNWSWSWARYRDTARFGANRMSAAAMGRGRQTFEQTMLAGAYDFGTLGIFTRSVGLATLIAGRIGSVTMMSLYPVITRAEQRSERFQRMAGLVLRGVCWATIPAATLLAICADDVVALLYGQKWLSVTALLPLAAASVGLTGIASTLSSLLLAGNETRISLAIDFVSASVAVGLAFLVIPLGIKVYLATSAAYGLLLVAVYVAILVARRGIQPVSILQSFLPPVLASTGATLTLQGIQPHIDVAGGVLSLRLLWVAVVFSMVCLAIIRLVFPKLVRELLEVAPGGQRIARFMRL